MDLQPNLQPGLIGNADLFSQLSTYTGFTDDGEYLQLPPKPTISYNHRGFAEKSRSCGWITTLVGSIGERIVQSLLPDASHTGRDSANDIQMPSAHTKGATVLVEVKTAQTRNRGVIRTSQVDRYKERASDTDIYYAQLFYQMKNGRMPSDFNPQNFEENFLPLCIYIFPISFIIYLVNTIHPTGQKESTQFYGLTHHRARSMFNMLHNKGLFSEEITKKYRAQIFTTTQLPQNPGALLHVIDHAKTPHILGHTDILK